MKPLAIFGLSREPFSMRRQIGALFEQIRLRELERTDNAGPLRQANIEVGNVAYGSLGTSGVSVAGTIYMAEAFLRRSMLATGMGILNGTIAGTDNVIYALYDVNGRLVARTASTLHAGTDVFQEIAFTTPARIATDGRFFFALQVSGVTATNRRMAASTFLNRAGSVTGSFGTIPGQIAVPTTFTAATGPFGYLY